MSKCFKVAAACALIFISVSVQARQPNIIFIVADDLGYNELGCFGQNKIRTPNIDRMAAEGMRFTRHYSGNAVCAPSRCVLMTGKHPGHAAIRNNREVKPEGQTPLPAGEMTIAEELKQQGYATAVMGKWGLGPVGSEGDPLKQGFDRFFGYNCQRHAHNYYPAYLYDNDKRIELNNPPITVPSTLPAGADPKDPASYRPFTGKDYAPDLTIEQALKFIRQNEKKPFCLFYATTIPHLSLQVPEDSLAEYAGKLADEPYVGGNGYLPQRYPHAAYAAMITRLDRYVGQMMALVKELGLDNDTIFVFTSDNGTTHGKLGGTDPEFFNSIGSLRGLKGSLYEGGVRVPLIVRWKTHIVAGKESDRMTGFEDWFVTLLNLIGIQDQLTPKIDSISFAQTLLGQQQPPREFLYREFPGYDGQQAAWMGDWKAVRQKLGPKAKSGAPIETELYNLKDDPSETKNVAAQHADIVKRLEQIMREQHEPSKLFPLPAIDKTASGKSGN